MYVTVDVFTFTDIENLSFSPAVDLTGTSIPINEFTVDIHTDAQLSLGEIAELYDDQDNLWAHYWIISVTQIGPDMIQIRAQSDVALLDRYTLPASYYSAVSVKDVLDRVMQIESDGLYVDWPYTLHSSLTNATVTGFCPEQTARERLLWVCFTIGGYVKAAFNDRLEILPLDGTAALVPLSNTYMRPSVKDGDNVTAVVVKSYAFTLGEPSTMDEWVTDGTDTWIVTEQTNTLTNTNAPPGTLENVVTIEGVYLVNSANVSSIMTFLAQWYFNTARIEADVIDNATYIPGDKVMIYADEQHIKAGFVTGASFAFGLQAKARLSISGATGSNPQDPTNPDVATGGLVILYTWDAFTLDRKEYALPVGYSYNIINLFIDIEMNAHRYIFRPENAAATGNIVAGGSTDEEPCAVALDLHEGVLMIVSVDEATQDSQTVEQETIYIGVIA